MKDSARAEYSFEMIEDYHLVKDKLAESAVQNVFEGILIRPFRVLFLRARARNEFLPTSGTFLYVAFLVVDTNWHHVTHGARKFSFYIRQAFKSHLASVIHW
jgi:hypothetical protein